MASSLEEQAARSCSPAALSEWRRELLSPRSTTMVSLACRACGAFREINLYRLLSLTDVAGGITCRKVNHTCLEEEAGLQSPILPPRSAVPASLGGERSRPSHQERRTFAPTATSCGIDTVQWPGEGPDPGSPSDTPWACSPERLPGRPIPRRPHARRLAPFVPFNGTLHSHSRDSILPTGLSQDFPREGLARGTADPAMYVWGVLATQLVSEPPTMEDVEEFQRLLSSRQWDDETARFNRHLQSKVVTQFTGKGTHMSSRCGGTPCVGISIDTS